MEAGCTFFAPEVESCQIEGTCEVLPWYFEGPQSRLVTALVRGGVF